MLESARRLEELVTVDVDVARDLREVGAADHGCEQATSLVSEVPAARDEDPGRRILFTQQRFDRATGSQASADSRLELGPLPEVRLDRARPLDALAKGARVDGGEAVELRLDLLEVAA